MWRGAAKVRVKRHSKHNNIYLADLHRSRERRERLARAWRTPCPVHLIKLSARLARCVTSGLHRVFVLWLIAAKPNTARVSPALLGWRVAAGIPIKVRPAALAEPDLERYTIRLPA